MVPALPESHEPLRRKCARWPFRERRNRMDQKRPPLKSGDGAQGQRRSTLDSFDVIAQHTPHQRFNYPAVR